MTFRTVITTVVCACAVVTACGGSDGDNDRADEDTPAATTATTDGGTIESTVPPSTTAPPEERDDEVPEDWAAQLIAAFDTYDQRRQELDEETSRRLGEEQPQTEQELFDILAEFNIGWADAGDVLTASVPAAVPSDVEPPFSATMEAHQAHVDQLRVAADGMLAGDPEPENERTALLDTFEIACAELQFTLLDLGAGDLACGIRGEDPDERAFVEGPTVDSTDALVEMPAGGYELDYVGGPEFTDLVVGLVYESDRLIRSSIEVVEIADSEDGPSIRLHANELVADPTDLAEDRIANFWSNTDGPGPWLGALDGVVVTATGTGEISGFAAEYWDVVSEREAPIAILGDGDDWVPETTLDPGQPVRMWAFVLDGRQLVLTEHVPAGAELADFEVELAALRDGLSLSTG